MKVLQLNVWMGKVEGTLQRFLEQNDFDVICLQEVMASENQTTHLSRLCFDLSRIVKASRMPHCFFAPNFSSRLGNGSFELGNAILSRAPIVEQTSEFIHGEFLENVVLGESPANNLNLQLAKLENGATIVNHHGFWRPNPMGDEESVKAFQKVGEIVRQIEGPLVMCGDLNIVHSSPAFRPLDFLRDLTDEYQVETTLSGLKFDGAVACDHILVNDLVEVQDFTVRPELVSDHLAVTAEVSF